MIISADDYAAVCLKVARISDEDPLVKLTGPKNKTGKEMLQNVKVSIYYNFLKRMDASKRGYNCSIYPSWNCPLTPTKFCLQPCVVPACGANHDECSSSVGAHVMTQIHVTLHV